MKQVLLYSNIAKKGKIVYDPATGTCQMYKVKETVVDENVEIMNMIKAVVAKNPDETFTFIINRNMAVPAFTAMKVLNIVFAETIAEEDMDAYREYMTNLTAAGIDPKTVNTEDISQVVNMCKAAIANTWVDDTALTYILELCLSSDHKFINIDNITKELEEGVVLSPISQNVRTLALELVNERCLPPEIQKVEIEEEDEEIDDEAM